MKKILLSLLLSAGLFGATNYTGSILETMSSGGYTYMKVDDGKNSYWIAMTQRDVKKGDKISYSEQGWMQNFHSKTLNRTFDSILFAGATTSKSAKPEKKVQNITPSKMHSDYTTKGVTPIAELFKNREKYVNKTITVKGKVTKTSSGIMKLNWIHIQDGSNFQNMNDLVFTSTQTPPKVGEVVYAKGKLIKDKDFGYGYFYPVIIQETSFKK